MGKYLTIISALALAFYFMFASKAAITDTATKANIVYSDYLTSAVQDATKKMKETADTEKAMPNPQDRQAVSDTFFDSLATSFNYVTEEDKERLHVYVPALVLIDRDGYYIEYNERSSELAGTKLKPTFSCLIPWTNSDAGNRYIVRYNLSENVSVTDSTTGNIYNGNYLDVSDEIREAMTGDGQTLVDLPDSLRKLGFSEREDQLDKDGNVISDSDSEDHLSDNLAWFVSKRSEVIEKSIEEKVNYYINNNNIAAAVYKDFKTSYKFTMPEIDSSFGSTVKDPTCIAFLQGIRASNTETYLNIYALSGGELRKKSVLSMNVSENAGNVEKTFYKGEQADAAGYVPGEADAARSGQMAVSTSEKLVPHVHVGDPLTGTGCYGLSILHKHTDSCYSYDIHKHVDASGNDTTKIVNGLSVIASEVPASTGAGGCYTTPRYHRHSADCYKFTGNFANNPDYHHHTGSPETGGGCYTVPIYHVHTSECYSKEENTVYQPTKKYYHQHTYPTLYYALMDGSEEDEYTEEEIEAEGLQDEAYVVRADATDENICYRKIIYRRPVFKLTGTKTLVVNKTYSLGVNGEVVDKKFTAPVNSIYTVTAGAHVKEISLLKGEQLRVEIGRTTTVTNVSTNEVVLTTGERSPEVVKITLKEEPKPETYTEMLRNVSLEDGKTYSRNDVITGTDGYYAIEGTIAFEKSEEKEEVGGDGKSLVERGYTYYRMENTCGIAAGDVEKEEPIGEPIVSKKKGSLICGKTTKTIEGYALGCGKIDLSDLATSGLYDPATGDGRLSSDYILKNALEGYSLKCGKTENTIEAYTLSCGIPEGNVTNIRLTCGKDEDDTDGYKLSCGLKEGEMITEERQQELERRAAG